MNLVVLSTCDVVDVFLIREIQQEFPELKVLRPVPGVSARRSSGIQLRRLTPSRIGRRLQRVYKRLRKARRKKAVANLLLGDGDVQMPHHEPIPRDQVNEAFVARRIQEMAPDVLLVSGAPILHRSIWTIPRIAAINVHFGIAPHYRGEDTLFWALYFEDYDRIGVTLHVIDDGVDSGPILARGYPELGPTDTEETLSVKCARLAAMLVKGVLKRATNDGFLEGKPQEEAGRQFRARERTIWRDIHASLRRSILARRPPRRASRWESFV